MKVLVLTCEQPNQAALCHKIAAHCEIAAIVLSENIPRKAPTTKRRLRTLFNKVTGRIAGRPFVNAWHRLQQHYRHLYPSFPDVPIIRVRNVNDEPTLKAIEEHQPDLVIVSGTNLVGKKVMEAASRGLGIVNLHTGISPYIKGGPNCTNWCLAEGELHLIGNTVMWLDAGIDTGEIIATEQTPLEGSETLDELHLKVMEHAHDLYVRAILEIARGAQVPSVPQSSVAEGKTFYNVEWGMVPMLRARANFGRMYRKHFSDRERHAAQSADVKLFPLAK